MPSPRRRPPPLRTLIGAQLALLLVAGLATVVSMPRFTLDEMAHYSYVQSLAEDGRIPWVGRDLVSPEAEAIYEGTYPEPGRLDRAARGLGGFSYEGFQPPLYYVVAAPVFLAGGADHVLGLRLLRLLGLGFLLACAWLLWRLAQRVAAAWGGPVDAPALYALGLTVLLWPGVVLRTVTASNAGLEMVLDLATAIALWDAWERRTVRRLLLASLLVGLGLLTRLSLVAFVPSLAVLAWLVIGDMRGRGRGRLALGAAVIAIPLLPLAPWVAFNLDRYGAPTAAAQVRTMQEPVSNPSGERFGIARLPQSVRQLSRAVLAEEWWRELLTPWKRWAGYAFATLFAAATIAGVVYAGRRVRARLLAVLALPALATLGWMLYALLVGNWDFFLPRYLYPEIAGAGLLAALGARALLGGVDRRVAWAGAALTGALCLVWLRLAFVAPFTG